MSITDELMECIKTAAWSYEDGMGSRHVLHIYADELADIAQRIRKAAKDAVDKAHADGERSALKQARSATEDYRKGYETGYETGYADAKAEDVDEEGSSRFEQGSGITDELRDAFDSCTVMAGVENDFECVYITKDAAMLLADRIDERHGRALADAELCVSPTEAQMEELGWVKLPVDADGVPIHVGDEVEVGSWPATPCIVRGIGLGGTPWVLRIVQRDHEGEEGYGEMHLPWPDNRAGETVRHIQPDSWERIIGDAMGAFLSDGSPAEPTMAELVERCRRLADGQGR